jgi:Rps23 Pro-64 3,4-dihydroxylase Tpa1-like proline 4-hydroxylase
MQDCARQQVVDIKAVGGTLVLFDSVSVKHMVLPVTAGKRLALGGWFHEPYKEYASWYDSAFTAASDA